MMRIRSLGLWAVLLVLATGQLFGQTGATGSILGTVTDSSGAVLPKVKVTVTNVETGVAYHTVTSSSGDYDAPSLNPGTYSVMAEAPGFERSKSNSFTLQVDQKVRIDIPMKPGAVTVTEEVTAQDVELDTDSAALSQEMSGDQVANLPLNGRNFMQLLLVGAGAVTVGGEQGTMRQGEGAAVSINGGRPEGNNYTLDGLSNTDQALVTPAVILSQDAIGEFKVESGIYPAENGFGASQVNLVSKSGTNALHGTLFESDRNNAFDAKPFTNASYTGTTPTSNPVLRLNQFGFVADGPVYIPKIYNGRDKTFFMANYEGWRMNTWRIKGESPFGPAIVPPLLVSHFVLSVQFDHTKPFAIGSIHTFHDSEIFEPIPVGAKVRITAKAIDKFVKRERRYVRHEITVADVSDDRLYFREIRDILSR